jgi:hypothetical protein
MAARTHGGPAPPAAIFYYSSDAEDRNGQDAQEASQYQQPGVSQRLAQLVEIDQPEIEQRTEQYETGRIIARPSSSQITIKKA